MNFDCSKEDTEIIFKIAQRADVEVYGNGEVQDIISTTMDLTLANNECPLDLEALLVADPYDFAHDVAGIRQHINRRTGVLEGCFLPRYAKHQGAA